MLCPITYEIMRDPVMAEDGHTYERTAIAQWWAANKNSPMTREVISNAFLPNRPLRELIQDWLQHNPGHNEESQYV